MHFRCKPQCEPIRRDQPFGRPKERGTGQSFERISSIFRQKSEAFSFLRRIQFNAVE